MSSRELAFFDLVELVFQAGGETDVEDIFEALHEKVADLFAEQGRSEAALVLIDVFALDDGGDDCGVGRRAPDALFFELFYERRLGVARRRLGEVLLGANGLEAQSLAFGDAWKRAAFGVALILFFLLFLDGLVGGEKTVEFDDRAGRAEQLVVRIDVDGGLVEDGRDHL